MTKALRPLILILLMLLSVQYPVLAQMNGSQAAATQTELSQLGRSLKPDISSLEGGVYTNISDLLRPTSYAKVLNNLQMTQRGIWTSRLIGTSKVNGSGAYNSGASILEIAIHYKADGTERLVAQVGGKVYSLDYNTANYPATEISTGLSTTAIPCIRSFDGDNMIYTNGDVDPKKWNGDTSSSMSALGGWPLTVSAKTYEKPKYCEVFASRAVFAGFGAYPFSIVFSAQGDPASYTISTPTLATDGGVFTVPTQLGKIVGLKALRLSNDSNDQVLLIGCERGMAVITGAAATTFALKEMTREYGLRGNRTWVQIQNDLLFLATDGIRRFSQLVTNVNLLNSSITFPVQDLVNQISTSETDYQRHFAVHHPVTQEIQYWVCTSAGNPPSKALILNYNTGDVESGGGAVENFKPVFSTKDGITVTCAIDRKGVMLGGSTTGYLYSHYTADTYDGSAINWAYVSALYGANSPAQNASVRKFTFITDGTDQKFDAVAYTLDTKANGDTEWTTRDSKAVSVTSSIIADISTWASGNTTRYPKFMDFSPKGSGRYWALKLSGDATDEHISLVGIQSILTVGGWKQ